jgi:hypothetical protein
MIANSQAGTTVDEIASGIYRISIPFRELPIPGGFSFNQYLIVDEEPLLFHTGLRRTFPLVREAISKVMPVERLRHVGLSHFEADESWSAERVPPRGALSRAAIERNCSDGVGERRGRPSGAGLSRWGANIAREARTDVDLHTTCASRLGLRRLVR